MAPIGKKAQSSRDRRSRSRNTTPVSASTTLSAGLESTSAPSASYLQTSLRHSSEPPKTTVEEVLEQYGSITNIPSSNGLIEAQETVKTQFSSHHKLRGDTLDRLLRELAKRKKERVEQERETEVAEQRQAEERKQKLKIKSRKREPEEERPPAVGAHGVARQDGVDLHRGKYISHNVSLHIRWWHLHVQLVSSEFKLGNRNAINRSSNAQRGARENQFSKAIQRARECAKGLLRIFDDLSRRRHRLPCRPIRIPEKSGLLGVKSELEAASTSQTSTSAATVKLSDHTTIESYGRTRSSPQTGSPQFHQTRPIRRNQQHSGEGLNLDDNAISKTSRSCTPPPPLH